MRRRFSGVTFFGARSVWKLPFLIFQKWMKRGKRKQGGNVSHVWMNQSCKWRDSLEWMNNLKYEICHSFWYFKYLLYSVVTGTVPTCSPQIVITVWITCLVSRVVEEQSTSNKRVRNFKQTCNNSWLIHCCHSFQFISMR